MSLKALSVRAPWWWFILHGGKDIENRDWSTSFRGTIYLHSSSWWNLSAVSEDSIDAVEIRRGLPPLPHPAETTYRQMRDVGGSIVGQVDIVGCVSRSDSPWFFGRYGFVLANPIAYAKPVPCKGSLGFFEVPDTVLAQLAEAA